MLCNLAYVSVGGMYCYARRSACGIENCEVLIKSSPAGTGRLQE